MGTKLVAAGMVSAALLLGACSEPRVKRLATFDEAEYAPYNERGGGKIIGQAFRRARDGSVRCAAGCEIVLTPVTMYSREWYQRRVIEDARLEPGDPRAEAYTRVQVGDPEGRFTFESVPPGEYFVATWIHWEEPSEYWKHPVTVGGAVGTMVKLERGEVKKVMLTR